MPRDGYHGCSRRRIRCDRRSPECDACIKRGIQCTGTGIRIRFVATNAVVARPTKIVIHGKQKTCGQHNEPALASTTTGTDQQPSPLPSEGALTRMNDLCMIPDSLSYASHSIVSSNYTSGTKAMTHRKHEIDSGLQSLDPGVAVLFNHCEWSSARSRLSIQTHIL